MADEMVWQLLKTLWKFMPTRSQLLTFLSAGLLLAAGGATSRAVSLQWGSEPWAPGSLSNSFDVDPSSPGNDITVTVGGDTGQLQTELVAPNPLTPSITSDLEGGFGPSNKSLCIAVDLANQSQGVVITVDFSAQYAQGVTNVSFTIFDVDFSNSSGGHFQDQLRSITALSIDGTTLIAPTITTSVNNTLSGTGLNQVVNGIATTSDTGATSSNANVTISFGANAIKSFTFTYGSGSGTDADPTYEHIGLGDITFTPVPEMNPAWGALVSCFLATALVLRHRGNFRK
jgi:hypothetical protein